MNLRLKKVAEILNNATTNEDRVVVYTAYAMNAITTYYVEGNKNEEVAKRLLTNTALVIDDIASFFGELALVDKMLLKDILRKAYNFIIPKKELEDDSFYLNSLEAQCFADVLRTTKFFSKETIDLIDSKFDLYKVTTISCGDVKESLKSIIYKD